MELLAEELESLFAGNMRSYGQWTPGKTTTIKEPPDFDRFLAHLQGKRGLGIVPIRDNGTCTWGAIDIDCHGKDEPEIDLIKLEQSVRTHDLPLLVCRSKSGGAHCYLFVEEPVKANLIRAKLTEMARVLGFPKAEIFPKQSRLVEDEDGERQLGNFINLPFYDHDKGNRYAIMDGERVPTEQAIHGVAKVSKRGLIKLEVDPHAEAPPCLRTLMEQGVSEGGRNEYLYNLVVYMKKAFPDDYRDRVREEAANSIHPRISKEELEKTLKSASRREYPYRCRVEPCASVCELAVCRTRKHGVGGQLDVPGMPQFGTLIKYDPLSDEEDPTYKMTVDNRSLVLTLSDIINWKTVKRKVFGKLDIIMPDMKQGDWELVLAEMMKSAKIERSPDSITAVGEAISHLSSFLSRMITGPNESDMEGHNKLMDLENGHPVLHTEGDTRWVCYRGESFMQYLRRAKCQPRVMSFMWQRMGEIGMKDGMITIEGRRMNVMKIEYTAFQVLMKDGTTDFSEPTLKIVNRIQKDEEF